MGQARDYQLSMKEVKNIIMDQTNKAVDACMSKMSEEAIKPEAVKQLKDELRRIFTKGEMIY